MADPTVWMLAPFSVSPDERDALPGQAAHLGLTPIELPEVTHLDRLQARARAALGILVPYTELTGVGQPISIKLVRFDAEIVRMHLYLQSVLVYQTVGTGVWIGHRLQEGTDPASGQDTYHLVAFPAARQPTGE